MSPWLVLLIIVIIIFIIWWALRRNSKTYQPDFETHAHEHEAEHEAEPLKAALVEEAAPEPVTRAAPLAQAIAEETYQPLEVEAAPEAPVQPDDFLPIEGIGPKINDLLHSAGIQTLAQLAAANADSLRAILEPAGLRFIDPASWPEQAQLLTEGKMEALAELQSKLKGGRRVE